MLVTILGEGQTSGVNSQDVQVWLDILSRWMFTHCRVAQSLPWESNMEQKLSMCFMLQHMVVKGVVLGAEVYNQP